MPSLAARHVFVGANWLSPGRIEWDRDGIIRRVAKAPKGARIADVAVLPGLVNAHAHLQLDTVGEPPATFLEWVGNVMAARGRATSAALAATARAHLAELLRDGCTAVGEIDSVGTSPRAIARAGFAGRCYQEVTGFQLGPKEARALLRARAHEGSVSCPSGWSPHAPYSVSPALFAACRASRQPMTVHVAELPEEQQFLRTGRGPFRELLQQLGRLPADFAPPGVGAVRHLERHGLLSPKTLLVHCQELERGDASHIAASGAPVVVCPGTIRYFSRVSPPVEDWIRRGIPVALGTDSRASNRAMSMQHELVEAARMWPGLHPLQLLAMATENGARGLSHRGIGRIRRGARADCFAIACADDPCAALESFVHGVSKPLAVWLGGRLRHGHVPGPQG
jgi:aminodeoxyfutalosine deaminase